MESNRIVHICSLRDWRMAEQEGEYRAPSLESEGFIHCSRPEQVLSVANRFYPGLPDLVLLSINPEKVRPEIRWEAADGAVFPHIYGPLNLDALTAVRDFPPDEDGIFRALPKEESANLR